MIRKRERVCQQMPEKRRFTENNFHVKPDTDADVLDDLYTHPGFLIRRAQQVSVALFYEMYGRHGITPTQATVLHTIERAPGIDQMTVARLLDLDRSTAAMVINTLARAKYLTRPVDPTDRRRRVLAIAPSGRALLKRLGAFEDSRDALTAVFTAAEARAFVRLLRQFISGQERRAGGR
jgi:DNA-binding MarR family transcriptional regulator